MQTESQAFSNIANNVVRTYHSEMNSFLSNVEEGTLKEADVIVMIMNLTIGVGTNIYYSLKDFLPNTVLDFDFMKAKIINSFVDAFEKIKEYEPPKDDMMKLDTEQLKELVENGFVNVTMPDGSVKKVTDKDLLFKKEEIDAYLEKMQKEKESLNGANPPQTDAKSH